MGGNETKGVMEKDLWGVDTMRGTMMWRKHEQNTHLALTPHTNLGVLQESNLLYEAGRDAIYREAKHTPHSPTTEESKDGPRNYLAYVVSRRTICGFQRLKPEKKSRVEVYRLTIRTSCVPLGTPSICTSRKKAFKKDIITCTPSSIHDGYSNEQRSNALNGKENGDGVGVEASCAGIQYCVGEVGFIWGRPMRGWKRGKEERDVVRRQKVQTGAVRRDPSGTGGVWAIDAVNVMNAQAFEIERRI
ncbi:hypothetical protein B0H13DRAFT_2272291 [Mycena leptocephala]|nr:hypothetical protein B0H13DRAFT_2272291 [Mycena leptocephala]